MAPRLFLPVLFGVAASLVILLLVDLHRTFTSPAKETTAAYLIAVLLSIASGTGVGFALRYRLAAKDTRQPAVSQAVLDGLTEAFGDAKPAFLSELIRLFLDAAPDTLSAIQSALAGGDLAGAARGAHTLQGAAAQMGAVRLSEICRTVEEAASAGKLEQARATFSHARPEFKRVELELRNLAHGIKSPGTF